MHSNLIDEDRSVKSKKSGGSFGVRQCFVYEPQKQPKNHSSSFKNGVQFVLQRVSISLNC